MVLHEKEYGKCLSREVDFNFEDSFDIIVVGLGTAGAIAAIKAAEMGMRVLGIERHNAMGGTGTIGGIEGYYYGARGGFYEQLDNKTMQLQKKVYAESERFKSDPKKFVYESELLSRGAQIMYNTAICGVYAENSNVLGIRVLSNGCLMSFGSSVVIDATGEAEVCSTLGCELSTGRKSDSQTQPYSSIAIVYDGKETRPLNIDAGYVNYSNSLDTARAIIEANSLEYHLKEKYNPDNKYVMISPLPGIREGRCIKSEKNITLNDALNRNTTDKPLYYVFSNVDCHTKDTVFENDDLLDWYIGAGLWGVALSIGIPLETHIPKGYNNILVAGRCLGVEHSISSSVRMKTDMCKCGEATAVAASLAVRQGVDVRKIAYDDIKEILIADDCLDKSNDLGFADRKTCPQYRLFKWYDNTEGIIEGLSSDSPGIAIWSAKIMGEKVVPWLLECLGSSNNNLRKHSAIALGLMGNNGGISELLEMASEPDGFIPKSSLKYVYTRGTTAIYLLGKLREEKAKDVLMKIIKNNGAFEHEFTANEFYSTKTDMRFQYFSHAFRSLGKIYQTCENARKEIHSFVYENISNKPLDFKITLKSNPYISFDMDKKLKDYAIKLFC